MTAPGDYIALTLILKNHCGSRIGSKLKLLIAIPGPGQTEMAESSEVGRLWYQQEENTRKTQAEEVGPTAIKIGPGRKPPYMLFWEEEEEVV